MSDDQSAQFIVTLGSCLDSARLADLHVEIELEDGNVLAGVPTSSPTASDGQEIDHTGISPWAQIGGHVVMLERVRSYRVMRPD